MGSEALERSIEIHRGVLANVRDDQLDDPTPCESWDVRAVVNHVINGGYWSAAAMTEPAAPDDFPDTNYAAGDRMAAFDECAKRVVAAFGAPGADEKVVKLPMGDLPSSALMAMVISDLFTHAWDLAKATGQDTNLAPEFAEQLYAQSHGMVPEAMRSTEPDATFGPEVTPLPSATPADRWAAYLGRSV
jgi:uncharacterized protein (TIGR03086 family)